jgi:hypothetical protein
VERDRLGPCRFEDLGKPCSEGLVRPVVRPQSEDAARFQVPAQALQPFRRVKVRIFGGEPEVRRMVDIDEDRVEAPAGRFGIEPGVGGGEREEIAVDEPAARVAGQFRPERQKARFVPVDDGIEGVNDDQRA